MDKKYKGVWFHKPAKKWAVHVRNHYLGLYKDKEEAIKVARMYREALDSEDKFELISNILKYAERQDYAFRCRTAEYTTEIILDSLIKECKGDKPNPIPYPPRGPWICKHGIGWYPSVCTECFKDNSYMYPSPYYRNRGRGR